MNEWQAVEKKNLTIERKKPASEVDGKTPDLRGN